MRRSKNTARAAILAERRAGCFSSPFPNDAAEIPGLATSPLRSPFPNVGRVGTDRMPDCSKTQKADCGGRQGRSDCVTIKTLKVQPTVEDVARGPCAGKAGTLSSIAFSATFPQMVRGAAVLLAGILLDSNWHPQGSGIFNGV